MQHFVYEGRNQRGELCGVERWEGFGYRRTETGSAEGSGSAETSA